MRADVIPDRRCQGLGRFALLALVTALVWGPWPASAVGVLDLAGIWRCRLDSDDVGLRDGWASRGVPAEVRLRLPSTTDLAGLGSPLNVDRMQYGVPFPITTRFPGVAEPSRADEHGYLVRRWLHVGPAWYEREVEVPASWNGAALTLRLERVLWESRVWWDGDAVGSCDSLVGEHRYVLGAARPGRHRLTVRVDNRLIHNLSTITHAYGPETQGRWNGLVGDLRIEARSSVHLSSLQAYPSADRRSVRVVVGIDNNEGIVGRARVAFRLRRDGRREGVAVGERSVVLEPGRSRCEGLLTLTEPALSWDEFSPIRYRVSATLESDGGDRDETEVAFGFRQVERSGRDLLVNGARVFLRGTLDCAVYPRTGHPPMSVSEWLRVLNVVKRHGFNHVRFHTWCPPEAAFEAADRLGVYLQAEAPAWVDDWGTATVTRPKGIGRDPAVTAFLRAELKRMSEAYGNHPSFLLGAIGNEFGQEHTDWQEVERMVAEIKAEDPRRLYAGCGARRRLPVDDFWFTHHSGSSTRGVGPAHTDWDFAAAAAMSPVPLIAHETGQRPVFPDYPRLLPKFVGPLAPWNLERFRRNLESNGLASRLPAFVEASARFQMVQYKAEHEAMLRTRDYSGYQLLMLHDFTGQSEALVGILDPFWESKGVVRARDVRRWNAPTVVLARFPKFVWTADETFRAEFQVADYSGKRDLRGPIRWSLKARDGRGVARGDCERRGSGTGGLLEFGSLSTSLDRVTEPSMLQLTARWGGVENVWNLWVYPPFGNGSKSEVEKAPEGVLVARSLGAEVADHLGRGGRVLCFIHGLTNEFAATTGFSSVYWSAGWWGNRFSTLGIVCDPKHPAFRAFPNEGWSDWQWRDLCAGATTVDLTGAPGGFVPVVQAVPDFHFNRLLGQVFEVRVGGGRLLICGYDLERDLEHRPAARQFRRSLLHYLGSDSFQPRTEVPLSWLRRRLE